MSSEVPAGFVPVTVAPAAPPNLEFNFLLPLDWRRQDLPPQDVNFDDPTALLALAVFIHHPSFSIFGVAARPAYEDGTVLDWLKYLAKANDWTVESLSPFEMNGVTGASTVATQENEGGRTRLRSVMIEDGKRLVTVTAMTQIEHWEQGQGVLESMLRSFSLLTPQGSTVPLAPEDA
jgi:hypothetical protein